MEQKIPARRQRGCYTARRWQQGRYWHLQHNSLLVKVGDTVRQDQQIALSGKTGYALFPHLHFIVWRNDVKGKWQQVATRFKTKSGDIYLRPGKKYIKK